MLNSYLELNFDVVHAATKNSLTDNNDIRLVILGRIVLFSKYKLTASPGKQLENIEHCHIACLMYKFLTTAKGCAVLSIGFGRSRDKRQRELTNNKKKENVISEFIGKI